MEVQLSTLFFDEPQQRGRWVTFPFMEPVSVCTPDVRVLQNCGSGKRGLKNMALGVECDPASRAFLADLGKLESFVTRAVETMYPAWSPDNGMLVQTFVSILKPIAVPKLFLGELRVNVAARDPPVEIVDDEGRPVEPPELQLGSLVRVRLEVAGVWCSPERYGLKYSVPRVELVRAP